MRSLFFSPLPVDAGVRFEVAPLTSVAEHFVIATGRSPRQLRALCSGIKAGLGTLGLRPLGMEGTPESGWMLLDFGDAVVHLFNPQAREIYDLAVLWGDAASVDWAAAEPLVSTTEQ